jgi:hypothetical protein
VARFLSLVLWRHPPPLGKPRPKRGGSASGIVQAGQSFGSIAATGIDLGTLEQINPRLHATALQPGNRVMLRHGAPLGDLLHGPRGAALAAAWRDLRRGEIKPAPKHANQRAF